jgi:DNA end-binding protein Ku
MRPMWTGSISFGLVNIPVRLYSASVEREFEFHMLHKKDLSPIRFARICRSDGKEVPYDQIVRGYEYQKGDYVVLTDEDFKKANLKRTKSIEIFEFVNGNEVDPMYFDRPYYIEPIEGSAKAYVLLREALARSGKVGVAKYVIARKEHLGILKPEGDLLLLDQMRFSDEVRKPTGLNIPSRTQASANEIKVALQLINHLTKPFHPEKYHDSYAEELRDVIEKKSHGKMVKVKGEEPEPTKMPDLMMMLKESLEKEYESRAVPKKKKIRKHA